jgi:ADP-ribose pyrophosphatase YjhB (NUDIX family)
VTELLLEAAVLGILVGWLRGGRLRNLGNQQLRLVLLALLAFLLQAGMQYAAAREMAEITRLVLPVHLLSYLLLFVFVFANRRLPGMLIMGFGIFLNFVVIMANGGVMPVSAQNIPPSLIEQQPETSWALHSLMTAETKLAFLADIISLPYDPLHKISIGDVILSLGLVFFLQRGMQARKEYKLTYFRHRV